MNNPSYWPSASAMPGKSRATATGLFMLCPGAGTAIGVGLHAGQVNSGVVIAAVATTGLVSLIGVLAVNFPAMQHARSVARILDAVLRGEVPSEVAIPLIQADDGTTAPTEQPPIEKRGWRSFLSRAH
jgi:hypothetical protein